jgi:carboxymethylenebutenolidase
MPASMMTLTVNDRPVQAYLALPESEPGPGVLLLHAWWGLKPFFQQTCERLAEEGFAVLAPDLREGQIATTIEQAEALMKASDNQQAGDIVMAAKDYLRALPAVQGGKIGVIGFSMGAAWAMVVAERAADEVAAAVLFYGASDADFSKVKAKVLGHFSPDDEWEEWAWVEGMEKQMRAAGLDVTIHSYPGSKHWFVEDDRPEYDPQASSLAWQRTFDFFKQNI